MCGVVLGCVVFVVLLLSGSWVLRWIEPAVREKIQHLISGLGFPTSS